MNKEQDLVLAELMIKLSAMERLLTKAGVFTSDDLTNEMNTISKEVMAFLTANAEKFFGNKTDN
jgi:hypothetical protein